MPESKFAIAARHVATGKRLVAEQAARIGRLKAKKLPTLDHELTLRSFQDTLKVFEDHEREMHKRSKMLK
jgi:hypothetical protein